ncbi:isocitrate/isopropylmalate dehydrogenase family protein [Desulfocurvus sp. DL9XJH121]
MLHNIAVIPGDGVGNEICDEAEKILAAAADKYGFEIKTTRLDWGCDHYLKNGCMMPEDGLQTLKGFDTIFLGCVGDESKVPDHISLTLLLAIRKGFKQYVNLRPIKLYPGVKTPIATATPESVDFMVVRENNEGEYSGTGAFFNIDEPDGFAMQNAIFSRQGCERVMNYAFDLAEERKKAGYKGMVTNCTKSNALNYSMVFWDKIYNEAADAHPGITRDKALVDALTMWMVKTPGWFDVIVSSNLFGDIITDLGSMLQGGMGFAAGGNINPEGDYPSMFEPIHGSAPKYTGKRVVNPIASIESARMLLDFAGEKEAAQGIGDAVAKVLARGEVRTKDMGGTHRTDQMGDAVRDALLED